MQVTPGLTTNTLPHREPLMQYENPGMKAGGDAQVLSDDVTRPQFDPTGIIPRLRELFNTGERFGKEIGANVIDQSVPVSNQRFVSYFDFSVVIGIRLIHSVNCPIDLVMV